MHPNDPKQPMDPMQQRRAERARRERIRKMRKKKQRQQLLALLGLVATLALIIVLLSTCIAGGRAGNETEDTSSEASSSQSAGPTIPEITWMTFPESRELTAQQYFVYDCRQERFLTIAGDPSERIYPASVTKLFTAYIAMQYLRPGDLITAGSELDLVAYGSSVAEIEKGDTLTAQLLVEGMLLPSGNDAAYVLAAAAGRIMANDPNMDGQAAAALFVEQMNKQAGDLGMTDTHFANPDGIHSDDHYTTYADLAILGKLSLENATILRYAKVASETVTFENGTQVLWENTNQLIDPASQYYCPLALGLKTGQTPYAGSCLLSAFAYNDTRLLIGVFGCPEKDDRFPDTLQLLNETLDAAR